VNHTDSKATSNTKENESNKSHNKGNFKNTNEEFASEIGVEDNSPERNPVSERSAWN